MARNGSGTHSIPNTMVAGTTITAADHNENYSDISTELTNSVAADGQTTMTGPLKASSGTVSAPSHTFGADTDTGAYRIGADNYGIAVGGTKIADISSTGLSITGTLTSSGALTVTSGGATVTAGGLTVTAGGITNTAGVLTNPVGAVGAPSYTFAGDTDSGIYRIGADNIGLAVAGAKVLDISATGLGVTGDLSATTISGSVVATQANQETGTSTTLVVTPGRQHYHPAHPKAWAFVTQSGGTYTLAAAHGVSSISKTGTGVVDVNLSTAFSSASYGAVVSISGGVNNVAASAGSFTTTKTTVTIIRTSNESVTDAGFSIMFFGDQ